MGVRDRQEPRMKARPLAWSLVWLVVPFIRKGNSEEEQAKAMRKNSGAVGVKREEGEWEQMQFSVHPSFQCI